MPQPVPQFMRFSAPDAQALSRSIHSTREELAAAAGAGAARIVELAADLGTMLTTARMEVAAVELLQLHADAAQAAAGHEPAAWFWNAYATALQYCGRHAEAERYFMLALDLARAGGWRRVEALILHHWGRSLVEQGRLDDAQKNISQELAIRVQLGEPRQQSSRKALAELAALRSAGSSPGDATAST
ncbi:tetratricopeptide repeat protein [Caenimonas terrae]|uniref:Tetratricopeptide repeat protein n=1 Tax=Caenimonas terrae TaxID=696074 RepID=A0ABW0NGK2_9BURK